MRRTLRSVVAGALVAMLGGVSSGVTGGGAPAESGSDETAVSAAPPGAPPPNLPPAIDPTGNRTIRVGEQLDIVLAARDPDGGVLRFTAEGLPEGGVMLDHGDGSAEVAWTPRPEQAGDHRVTFRVSDDGSPPEQAAETIVVRVEAIGPPTTHLEIRRARWSVQRSSLEVPGRTRPFASVDILAAGSGESIGTVTSDEAGTFALDARPLVVPCAVQARVGALTTDAVKVEGAPQECGRGGVAYLRIEGVEWDCAGSTLRVHGDRAPGYVPIVVYDAETSHLLGTTISDRDGGFDYRARFEMAPSRVEVGVVAGDETWLGEPVMALQGDGCASPAQVLGRPASR